MIKRVYGGMPPVLTFTSDFHELLRGDLRPGMHVRLRYDPARIVPRGEGYTFGDPAHKIAAHIIFPPHEDVVSIPLLSPVGMLTDPIVDVTGAGSMLIGTAHVPDDATSMVIWFTHDGPYGTSYDSDLGRNFRFGFASQEIRVSDAKIAAGAPGSDNFTISVAAVPEVHRVVAHILVAGETDSSDYDLKPSGQREKDGWVVWTLDPVGVPVNAVVRFKVYYWRDGVRYKDDNDGRYYLIHQGPAEVVPPPPAALAAAAKAWS